MESIFVALRVRPMNPREIASKQSSSWHVSSNTVTQLSLSTGKPIPGNVATYSFDRVYDINDETNQIYQEVAQKIVHSALDGFNGTIFAYGQTSSGKTFTMHGVPDCPGIIPQAVSDIFSSLAAKVDREFLVRVSYLEIYNEVVRDLLSPQSGPLKIHEDVDRGIFVGDLKEEVVMNAEEVLSLMKQGENNRHVGATNMNERSSRSHTIFRMMIESRSREDGNVRLSTLNLVDLAGSERAVATGAEGQRLKEGAHINKSLLTLGTVIAKLSSGESQSHIPYRDSKLTRILQPALGGNSLTSIIATITPAGMNCEESHSTLKFASRAKKIKNSAHINEVVFDDQALLKRYIKEIETLRTQIRDQEESGKQDEEIQRLQEVHKDVLTKLEEERENKQTLEAKLEKLQKFFRMESTFSISAAIADNDAQLKKMKKESKRRRVTWGDGLNRRKILGDVPEDDSLGLNQSSASAGNAAVSRDELSMDASSSAVADDRSIHETVLEELRRVKREEKEMSETQSRLKELEELLSERNEHVKSLQVQNSMLEQDNEDILMTFLDLKERLPSLIRGIETNHATVLCELSKTVELQACRVNMCVENMLRGVNHHHPISFQIVVSDDEGAKQSVEKLEALVGGLQAEKTSLMEQLCNSMDDKESLILQNAENEAEAALLKDQFDSMQRMLEETRLVVLSQTEEISNLKDLVLASNSAAKVAVEEKQVLFNQIKTMEAAHALSLTEHEQTVAKLTEDCDTLSEEVQRLHIVNEELTSQSSASQRLSTESSTSSSRSSLSSEAEMLRNQLSSLQLELDDERKSSEELRETLAQEVDRYESEMKAQQSSFESQIEGLKLQLKGEAEDANLLAQQIEELGREVTTLRRENGLIHGNFDSLQRRIGELVSEKEALLAEKDLLNSQITEYERKELLMLEEMVSTKEDPHDSQKLEELLSKINDLEDEKRALIDEKNDVAEKAMLLEQRIISASDDVAGQTGTAKHFSRDYFEKQKDILQKEIERVKAESERFKEENIELKRELSSLRRETSATSAKINATEKEKDRSAKEQDKILNRLKEADLKMKTVTEAKQMIVQEKAALERQLRDVSKRNEILVAENEKLKKEDTSRRELLHKLQRLEKDASDAEKTSTKVSSDFETLQVQYSEISHQLASSRTEIAVKDGMLCEMNVCLKTATEQLASQTDSIASLEGERDHLQSRQAEMECELENLRMEKNSLSQRLAELEKEKDDVIMELRQTMTEAEKWNELAVALEKELLPLKQEVLPNMQMALGKEQREKKAAVDEKERLSAQITDLVWQLEEISCAKNELTVTKAQLTEQLSMLKQEHDAISLKVTESNSEAADWKHRALQAEQELGREIDDLSSQLQVTNNELSDAKRQNHSFESQVSELTAELCDLRPLREHVAALQISVETMQERDSVSRDRIDQLVAKLQKEQKDRRSAEQHLESARERLSEIDRTVIPERNTLSSRAKQLEEEVGELKETNQELLSRFKEVENRMSKFVGQPSVSTNSCLACQALSTQLSTTMKELSENQSEYEDLLRELNQTKAKNIKLSAELSAFHKQSADASRSTSAAARPQPSSSGFVVAEDNAADKENGVVGKQSVAALASKENTNSQIAALRQRMSVMKMSPMVNKNS
eukprot:ANDGO_00512.mRNA.1 Kinesin-like protein KIN-7L